MVVAALVVLLIAGAPEPTPSATPLKTIIRVHSTPFCVAVASNVLYVIGGLQANDRLVESSKPVLLQMGKDFIPVSEVGQSFGRRDSHFGGTHDPSPALLLDDEHLNKLTSAIVYNLATIDSVLSDPTRFPTKAKTDDEQKELVLKSQLQAVADQQRKTLNTLDGLATTLSLQQLVAQGDGLQGATEAPGSKAKVPQVSQNDQDVSFQDVLSASDRGRAGPIDPTVDQDPAISQAPTDLTNNPMARFYLGVAEDQKNTALAENELKQSVQATVATCRQ